MRESNDSKAHEGRATAKRMIIEALAFTLPLLGILLMLLCWAGTLQWSPLHMAFWGYEVTAVEASAVRFFSGTTWFAVGALSALLADDQLKRCRGSDVEN